MGILKENIDHYMKLKGIKMYTHLLIDIAHELGIKGQQAYKFADKEKSNFSKMLKEERPLKHEFIIPLEKIFGVSLARLLDEEAYKLPVEKNNVPFNKGFRYYAYLDDPELYKEEFNLILAKDGKPIITQTDEFGKTFLDYVVEYHAVNGVRYLHNEYGIKLKWYRKNHFEFKKDSGITFINFENSIEFARLVASMNDVELFNDIYDSYNMFLLCGHYASDDTIFCQSEFLEIILDNDDLFNSLFVIKPYKLTSLTDEFKRERQVESVTYYSINPIINNCLRYALKHLDKYRQQAIEILEFGIIHNTRIMADGTYCIVNELGGLIEVGRYDYYTYDVVDMAIFVDCEVDDDDDDEMNSLIEQLPKFKKNVVETEG